MTLAGAPKAEAAEHGKHSLHQTLQGQSLPASAPDLGWLLGAFLGDLALAAKLGPLCSPVPVCQILSPALLLGGIQIWAGTKTDTGTSKSRALPVSSWCGGLGHRGPCCPQPCCVTLRSSLLALGSALAQHFCQPGSAPAQ